MRIMTTFNPLGNMSRTTEPSSMVLPSVYAGRAQAVNTHHETIAANPVAKDVFLIAHNLGFIQFLSDSAMASLTLLLAVPVELSRSENLFDPVLNPILQFFPNQDGHGKSTGQSHIERDYRKRVGIALFPPSFGLSNCPENGKRCQSSLLSWLCINYSVEMK